MGGLQLIGRTYRHLNRYREVAAVLAKHGFGDMLHALTLDRRLDAALGVLPFGGHVETAARPERVRLAIEELGPTFIKAGQYLSTRADLVPEEYRRELAKLQDHVPAFPAAEARAIVERELGGPVERLFARFDGRPLAAASIAQIHSAALRGGGEVVVKVRRPDIDRIVAVDLEIMAHLAALAERRSEHWRRLRPTRAISEIARSLDREIDFAMEAAHTERFARQFEGDDSVVAPAVHRELSTPRVLTLERVDGIKPKGPAVLERAGLDPRVVAETLARHYLEMIFTHGFFHADPHPGNLFARPDGAIAYVDFGMVGRLARDTRDVLADVVYAVAERDQALLGRSLLALAERDEEPDAKEFESDMAELMDQYAYRPLSE